MKKISLTLLIVCISITFLLNFTMPEFAGKMKDNISSMNILYSYSVTKTFSEQTHDTIEIASVPSRETETRNVDFRSDVKLEDTPLNIKSVVKESLNKPQDYKFKEKLTGPEKGFSYRKYYLTKNYDKGRYTVIRTNKITGKEKVYVGTYHVPSAQDPFVEWSRDVK
ncbi:hypothetical protein [Peribacillus simplex]|uniref:Uncharacterized protein n=1 Tax=Peribacillus simplex TaxID=1478 RepID=A0A9W4LCA5_9BACI|nr:hypothetical protein [Peribacillus simplex]MDR4929487.1 hypothetical protein [Peribacillus simplex]WHX90773.1 hypothetical protein QNH50_22775 [Peribacillus simplex]CAH0312210.1 hypothetical protein SRABI133_04988 [Peribacillus simplex]